VITRVASPGDHCTRHLIDHVIEMIHGGVGTRLDVNPDMTIQLSIGEIIEAMYEGLLETYGDRELALVAAQALGDDLLARAARTESGEGSSR
jgi:hypothetical protein